MTQREVRPAPGPWHAEHGTVMDAAGRRIATAWYLLDGDEGECQRCANARLLAAAPELLAVARHIVEIMTSDDDGDWFGELADDVGTLDEIIDRIRSGPLEVRS